MAAAWRSVNQDWVLTALACLLATLCAGQLAALLAHHRTPSPDLACGAAQPPWARNAGEAVRRQLRLPGGLGPEATLLAPEQRFAVFIIFSWNYEVFWLSLQSYVAAGWGRRIVIVDNSRDSRLVRDAAVNALVGEVIPTRVTLTFSQSQNFIFDIATQRGYDFLFWGHSDVALMAGAPSQSFAHDVLACLAGATASPAYHNWGIIYFAYDWFSAIRVDLIRDPARRYDTFVTVYMSDCDFYPRVRAAGWQTLNYQSACPNLTVHVFDLGRPLPLALGDYELMRGMLEAEAGALGAARSDWKVSNWGLDERVGWSLWEWANVRYMEQKWNTSGCLIEVVPPEQGAPQQRLLERTPFEAVAADPELAASNLPSLIELMSQAAPAPMPADAVPRATV